MESMQLIGWGAASLWEAVAGVAQSAMGQPDLNPVARITILSVAQPRIYELIATNC